MVQTPPNKLPFNIGDAVVFKNGLSPVMTVLEFHWKDEPNSPFRYLQAVSVAWFNEHGIANMAKFPPDAMKAFDNTSIQEDNYDNISG